MAGRLGNWAMDSAKAGAVYALLVFMVGFGLGTVRVLLLLPRMGATFAVSLEAPIMIGVSWVCCRWCRRWFQVGNSLGARLLMGGCGFAILMLGELGVSVLVFGKSVPEHLAAYASASGVIGLFAQLGFAGIPLMQGRSPA